MIIYDSRKVKPGDTFVAIPGQKHDGAEFVPQAIANGARVVVAEQEIVVPAGVEFKLVSSARIALAEMAAEFYGHPSKKLKLIGVTGTKGKTTVSYLVRSILNLAGFKAELIGTITNSMTTPESSDLQAEFARLVKEGYTHCVLEVSSHALAQKRVHGCHFAVAIFTNLTHDHLDYHKTMEEYLVAKRKLFKMLDREAVAIVNIDDPAGAAMLGVVPGEVVTYGLHQSKHELRSTKHNEFDTDVTDIDIRDIEMKLKINASEIRTPLIGLHNAYNITAAYQCGLSLGIRPLVIKAGIEAIKVIPGRQEEVDCGQPFRVIVDFAHTPDSLQKLIETYRPLTKGKIILVFGCPGDRDRTKRPLMGEIAARLADVVIITTDDPHSEKPEDIIKEIEQGVFRNANSVTRNADNERITRYPLRVTSVLDRKSAIEQALSLAQKGDIVLLAGRGHEKYQDFNGRKELLDDKVFAESFLTKRN